MKIMLRISALIIALSVSAGCLQAKPIPGPKGGRIVTTDAPHVEFFVRDDRTVEITFYDNELAPTSVADRRVTAIAEAQAGRKKLEFSETNGALISTEPLPAGDGYTVVVQVRESATARPKNYRVVLHDEMCAECRRAEYACTCEEGEHEGHGH